MCCATWKLELFSGVSRIIVAQRLDIDQSLILVVYFLALTGCKVLLARISLLHQHYSSGRQSSCFRMVQNITDRRSNCSFIQFDNKEIYPSITENILHQTLKFAKQHTNIDKNDLRIINHCRKSLLFSDNKTGKKKATDNFFHVIMGGFWTEICELVGLYIQSKLEKILPNSNIGL